MFKPVGRGGAAQAKRLVEAARRAFAAEDTPR